MKRGRTNLENDGDYDIAVEAGADDGYVGLWIDGQCVALLTDNEAARLSIIIDAARERSPLRWGGDGDGDAS